MSISKILSKKFWFLIYSQIKTRYIESISWYVHRRWLTTHVWLLFRTLKVKVKLSAYAVLKVQNLGPPNAKNKSTPNFVCGLPSFCVGPSFLLRSFLFSTDSLVFSTGPQLFLKGPSIYQKFFLRTFFSSFFSVKNTNFRLVGGPRNRNATQTLFDDGPPAGTPKCKNCWPPERRSGPFRHTFNPGHIC